MFEGLKHWQAMRAFKQIPREQRRIVIYAESGQDWHHFKPVVDHLTGELNESVIYITSKADDLALTLSNPNLRAFNVGAGAIRTAFFQWLDADVMVMTMVDLDNLQLKRSINPVYYVFMFHSLISTHMADHSDTYDHYDAILCAGPHHVTEIRKRESLHQLPRKDLFKHGYHRIEQLMEQRRDPPPCEEGNIHVLLAPSWGDDTILNVCGVEITGLLLDAGFRVTLRPHFQTRWITPEVIDRVLAKYGEHPQFSLQEQLGENDTLFDSHIMITDWSGAGMDYALGLEKPVLYIDVPVKARNDIWPELELEPFESYIRDKIGTILPTEELDRIAVVIRDLMARPATFRDNIRQIRQDWVFNVGHSAAAAAIAIQQTAVQAAEKRALANKPV